MISKIAGKGNSFVPILFDKIGLRHKTKNIKQ
jgi:hypothetical protein